MGQRSTTALVNSESSIWTVGLVALIVSCLSLILLGEAPWSPSGAERRLEQESMAQQLLKVKALALPNAKILFLESGEPFVLVEAETEVDAKGAKSAILSEGLRGGAFVGDITALRASYESHQELLDSVDAVTFEIRSASLDSKSRQVLKDLAPYLTSYPYKTLITSHKDGVISESLAQERLDTIRTQLEQYGVPSGRLEGEVKPVEGTLSKRIGFKATLRSVEE